MNREIIKYPNQILRKQCDEIKEITPKVKELALDMAKIMTENQGVGLAASQVEELKRIIVVRTENQHRVLVNPKIVGKSRQTEIAEEGCLSFPGLFLKIKRAKEVKVEALDLDGKNIQIKTEGLLARIFQHEIDHLDGILFIDKLSFWQRIKLKVKKYDAD